MDPFTIMLFLDGALGVVTIATLAYIASGRRPELRFTLVVSLLLLAALFAFLPLMPALRHETVRSYRGQVSL
ncbi:MAG: hypothetical protein HYZ72_11970 [Deltaproteobacteria bacterium]|nr:hypothetical protein [Deltaproteobacteria bacterium]